MLRGKIHDPSLKYNGGLPFSYTPQQLGKRSVYKTLKFAKQELSSKVVLWIETGLVGIILPDPKLDPSFLPHICTLNSSDSLIITYHTYFIRNA